MARGAMITRRSFSSMLGAATLAGRTAQQPLQLERIIPLKAIQGRIDHFAVDTKQGRLFVAALGNGSVEVIDAKHGNILHSITGLAEPQGLVYLPEVNRLYVATGGDGALRLYDGTSFQELTTVRLGTDADNVRFDPISKSVYVGYGEGALAQLDLNGKREADIGLSAHPESFQIEHGGPRLYVNVPDSKHVVVVNRENRSVIARWGTGEASANFPMALDESGKQLFAVCRRPARLLVFDTESGKILQNVDTVEDADDIFYDAVRHQLYVSGGAGAIAIHSCGKEHGCGERARIPTAPGARTSVFVAEWNRLFVAVPRRDAAQSAHLRVYTIGDESSSQLKR